MIEKAGKKYEGAYTVTMKIEEAEATVAKFKEAGQEPEQATTDLLSEQDSSRHRRLRPRPRTRSPQHTEKQQTIGPT